MAKTLRDRTLALAGLFQATDLVHRFASQGTGDQETLETAIFSLFEFNPNTTEAVFGGLYKLRTGLRILIEQMSGPTSARNTYITRYVLTLLHLERKFIRRKDMQAKIETGIQRAKQQAAHFHAVHENVLANLAGLYSDTISQLPPKIMVSGEHTHLANPQTVNKIRTLLLAGIRSAVLWDQCGGSRWHVIFRRRQLVEMAKQLLDEAIPPTLH